jgi:GDP-4-dehydro-6-deoxy-D-mannose reductase
LRALLSGGTGFVGSYLAKQLVDEGVEVYLLGLGSGSAARDCDGTVHYLPCDIRDEEAVRRVVKGVQPQELYHLAAVSSVPASWKNPRLTFEVNVGGTFNLFEASMGLDSPPRILIVSSGQVYEAGERGSVIWNERSAVHPRTPYATSKAMAELLAQQFVELGAYIITARSFNHIGPAQSHEFVLSDFARQFALIESGKAPPVLVVGNLAVERDFTDVRDVARAYRLLLRNGRRGEIYNVCSGHAFPLTEVVALLQAMTLTKVSIQSEQARFRTNELSSVCGDPSKLKTETGWQATIDLKTSLRDMLEYWRNEIASEVPQK